MTFLILIWESVVPPSSGRTASQALASDNTVTLKGESGSLSYLGRVAYSYADRYMLQFIFRSDASTKFAPENYWGFFPGISAGWITSEESWFKRSLPWFEFLKVRASWGRTGRDNIKMWKWKEQYKMDLKGMQFGAESGKPGTSLIPQSSPNRNVKWDVSDKFNLGFDTRFFDGRLSAVFDFYYDINDNILNQFMASQPGIPVYAGGSYAEENFGRVDTYGGELSLTWRDKVGQVNYNIGMDFGLNGSRVKEWVPGLRYNKYPSRLKAGRKECLLICRYGDSRYGKEPRMVTEFCVRRMILTGIGLIWNHILPKADKLNIWIRQVKTICVRVCWLTRI
ncbi:TonB-dependent receptor [Bacteroides thetaiotaomicron]|nr:TonB-dependent receptor [Bacteroides thetaiotaomicron]